MPPNESAYVVAAKVNKQAMIIADANDLKAANDHSVSAVRRAERDALVELSQELDSVASVDEIALPSVRLDAE